MLSSHGPGKAVSLILLHVVFLQHDCAKAVVRRRGTAKMLDRALDGIANREAPRATIGGWGSYA